MIEEKRTEWGFLGVDLEANDYFRAKGVWRDRFYVRIEVGDR